MIRGRIEWSASADAWFVVTYALGVIGPFDTYDEAEAVLHDEVSA